MPQIYFIISQVSLLRTLQRAESPIKPTFSLFCGPNQGRESITMTIMIAAGKEDAISQGVEGANVLTFLLMSVN